MTGIITSLPPLIAQPPGSASSNPAGLPGVTYTVAVLNIPQTWGAKQTFPAGMISIDAGDVANAASLPISTATQAALNAKGEYVQGDRLAGAPLALTTATAATLISISLAAGDWDVMGFVNLTPAATTNITNADLTISLVNNTFDFTALRWNQIVSPSSSGMVPNNNFNLATPVARLPLNVTTTVYLVVGAGFTVSTLTAYGSIRARRN
jgi:hypothetical protein